MWGEVGKWFAQRLGITFEDAVYVSKLALPAIQAIFAALALIVPFKRKVKRPNPEKPGHTHLVEVPNKWSIAAISGLIITMVLSTLGVIGDKHQKDADDAKHEVEKKKDEDAHQRELLRQSRDLNRRFRSVLDQAQKQLDQSAKTQQGVIEANKGIAGAGHRLNGVATDLRNSLTVETDIRNSSTNILSSTTRQLYAVYRSQHPLSSIRLTGEFSCEINPDGYNETWRDWQSKTYQNLFRIFQQLPEDRHRSIYSEPLSDDDEERLNDIVNKHPLDTDAQLAAKMLRSGFLPGGFNSSASSGDIYIQEGHPEALSCLPKNIQHILKAVKPHILISGKTTNNAFDFKEEPSMFYSLGSRIINYRVSGDLVDVSGKPPVSLYDVPGCKLTLFWDEMLFLTYHGLPSYLASTKLGPTFVDFFPGNERVEFAHNYFESVPIAEYPYSMEGISENAGMFDTGKLSMPIFPNCFPNWHPAKQSNSK